MTINSIQLTKPYITKKLTPNTFRKILGESYQTAYRLYLITNEIEELQHFITCNHPDLWITATIKTNAVPAAQARVQIWNTIHLKPLLEKRPGYQLKCSVKVKQTNQEIYRCELTTINQTTIYTQIQTCINDLKQLINEKNY